MSQDGNNKVTEYLTDLLPDQIIQGQGPNFEEQLERLINNKRTERDHSKLIHEKQRLVDWQPEVSVDDHKANLVSRKI